MSFDGIGSTGTGRTGDLYEALRGGRISDEKARLKGAAQLMEGQFYQQLFAAMRETVPDGGITSGGQGEEIFTSLLDQHVADAAAARGESRLSRALYRQLADQARLGDEP